MNARNAEAEVESGKDKAKGKGEEGSDRQFPGHG